MAIIAGDSPNAANAVSDLSLLAPPAPEVVADGTDPLDPPTPPAGTLTQAQPGPTGLPLPGPDSAPAPGGGGGGTTSTHTQLATRTATPTANASKGDSSSGGINSLGAKVGLGVGIPILLILIGAAIFFILRRRKMRAHESGDTTEKMITPSMDKQAAAGSILLSNNEHDHQHQYGGPGDGSMASAGSPYPGAGQAPLAGVAPGMTQHNREDEIDRPVSPVQEDDLLQDGGERDVRSAASNLRPTDRNVEDDGEMQWILEEERKQAERREQQGRLPTQR
ncbi:hypothetical protein DFH27DRAFT_526926 [Peziza echinospora]|nr:hypothetical protein DFH27DRAFT_526926 [Peziza echinospora]